MRSFPPNAILPHSFPVAYKLRTWQWARLVINSCAKECDGQSSRQAAIRSWGHLKRRRFCCLIQRLFFEWWTYLLDISLRDGHTCWTYQNPTLQVCCSSLCGHDKDSDHERKPWGRGWRDQGRERRGRFPQSLHRGGESFPNSGSQTYKLHYPRAFCKHGYGELINSCLSKLVAV